MYFAQLTSASEVQQETGGFPTRLVSLQHAIKQCIHKVSRGFSLLFAVLASKVGIGPFGFFAERFSYVPI